MHYFLEFYLKNETQLSIINNIVWITNQEFRLTIKYQTAYIRSISQTNLFNNDINYLYFIKFYRDPRSLFLGERVLSCNIHII